MAKPYPQELRDRVLAAYDRGMKTRQIATVFQVSAAWARRIKKRRRETGETKPRPMGGVTAPFKLAWWSLLSTTANQTAVSAGQVLQEASSNLEHWQL